ncbi:zinc-binding dehydrogenase [Nocardia nova]|uniref:zinc-binding dehydrogenase n=1 Tax=Nocardia nova TaxID=37330 RepID=UPI0007A3CD5B|nr:zinc-binding dehydrogenase [Nocardia nova]
MSKAVVLEEFGTLPVVREFPRPQAGPTDIVVACDYGGICGTDVHLQRGHLPIPTPLVLGHEGLGRIHELGSHAGTDSDGAALTVGDIVMWASSISCGRCRACRDLREPTLCAQRQTCGVNRPVSVAPGLFGSWADHIVLRDGTTIVKVPDTVDPLAAMAFACAGPTMVHALFDRRPVRVGEVVVVQGSGPVGLAAAAIAQCSGAETVVLAGGPARRLELAARAGIGDHHVDVVDAGDRAAAADEVRRLCGGGADLVIECTGVPTAVREGIDYARRGGAMLIVGQYTDAGDAAFNPHQIVYRQLDIFGSWAFSGAHLVEYLRLLPMLTERFDLTSLVTLFGLGQIDEALTAQTTGSVMKAVLDCGVAEQDPIRERR